MDRSIIVLMKSVKITFCVQKFKNFGGGESCHVQVSSYLPADGEKNQETAPKTSF